MESRRPRIVGDNRSRDHFVTQVDIATTTIVMNRFEPAAVPLSAPSQRLWSDFGVPIDEWRVNRCYCSWFRVGTFVYFIAGTVDDD